MIKLLYFKRYGNLKLQNMAKFCVQIHAYVAMPYFALPVTYMFSTSIYWDTYLAKANTHISSCTKLSNLSLTCMYKICSYRTTCSNIWIIVCLFLLTLFLSVFIDLILRYKYIRKFTKSLHWHNWELTTHMFYIDTQQADHN